jgi:hypothetical protein
VLTGVVQWIVVGIPLGAYDWSISVLPLRIIFLRIAAFLVSVSLILHTQFPPKPPVTNVKRD